jgi:hypothetical protein
MQLPVVELGFRDRCLPFNEIGIAYPCAVGHQNLFSAYSPGIRVIVEPRDSLLEDEAEIFGCIGSYISVQRVGPFPGIGSEDCLQRSIILRQGEMYMSIRDLYVGFSS